MKMISGTNIHKSFGTHEVLCGIDFDVKKGEVLSIIGPSGSGKSTLLRCINGLETVSRGSLYIEGELFFDRKRGEEDTISQTKKREIVKKVGMVFQHFNLFPHLTVLENIIEAPVTVRKISRKEAVERAHALLAKVGLLDKKDSYPSRISGGQKQRVAIARALGMQPDIMLFDEPTSALDPELVGEVQKVIRSLADEHMTMVIVTHEMRFAQEVANRIIFLDEGVVEMDATTKEFFQHSDHPRIKRFIRKIEH